MSSPAISVIIPTYNRAACLPRALRSLQQQTEQDFEVWIIDDGSEDSTSDVVVTLELPEKYHYIHRPHAGRSAARNVGLRHASGERIAFLDSDDAYLPNTLARQRAVLDSAPKTVLVAGAAYYMDEQGRRLSGLVPAPPSGWVYNAIACYVPSTILLPTVMTRRSVIEKVGLFDESLDRFEDTDLWRRIAKIGPITSVSEPLCQVGLHPTHLSIKSDTLLPQLDRYAHKVLREDSDSHPVCRRLLERFYCYYGWAVCRHESWRKGFAFYRRAATFQAGTQEFFRAFSLLAGELYRAMKRKFITKTDSLAFA